MFPLLSLGTLFETIAICQEGSGVKLRRINALWIHCLQLCVYVLQFDGTQKKSLNIEWPRGASEEHQGGDCVLVPWVKAVVAFWRKAWCHLPFSNKRKKRRCGARALCATDPRQRLMLEQMGAGELFASRCTFIEQKKKEEAGWARASCWISWCNQRGWNSPSLLARASKQPKGKQWENLKGEKSVLPSIALDSNV